MSTQKQDIIKIVTSLNLAVLLVLITNEWLAHLVKESTMLAKEPNVKEKPSEAQIIARLKGTVQAADLSHAKELGRLQSVAQASAKEIAILKSEAQAADESQARLAQAEAELRSRLKAEAQAAAKEISRLKGVAQVARCSHLSFTTLLGVFNAVRPPMS